MRVHENKIVPQRWYNSFAFIKTESVAAAFLLIFSVTSNWDISGSFTQAYTYNGTSGNMSYVGTFNPRSNPTRKDGVIEWNISSPLGFGITGELVESAWIIFEGYKGILT